MVDVATGLRLQAEAIAVLQRPDRGESFHKACNAKAVEISDYLGSNGDGLVSMGMAWLVDSLGNLVDQLAAGARGTLGAAMKSPTAAALASLRKDAETAGKFSLVGGGVLVVVVLVILALK